MGLMSGTSLDGIDIAVIRTDGEDVTWFGPTDTIAYKKDTREKVRATLGGIGDTLSAEKSLTEAHIVAVRNFLNKSRFPLNDINLIGFHGHTILHSPNNSKTWQIGDAKLMAKELATVVIADFRSTDVSKGGEGAPLAPVFHRSLARNLEHPICVLNIGGVANLTWINGNEILAFDTGPGNALIDDLVHKHTGCSMDFDGLFARKGKVNRQALQSLLKDPYFKRSAPKSLDRNHFSKVAVQVLASSNFYDSAATLTAFTAEAIENGLRIFPHIPKQILVCGGGRKNQTLMQTLQKKSSIPLRAVEKVGWSGDDMEAQLIAFLAVRSFYGLPISFPTTTGVPSPTTGGSTFHPS